MPFVMNQASALRMQQTRGNQFTTRHIQAQRVARSAATPASTSSVQRSAWDSVKNMAGNAVDAVKNFSGSTPSSAMWGTMGMVPGVGNVVSGVGAGIDAGVGLYHKFFNNDPDAQQKADARFTSAGMALPGMIPGVGNVYNAAIAAHDVVAAGQELATGKSQDSASDKVSNALFGGQNPAQQQNPPSNPSDALDGGVPDAGVKDQPGGVQDNGEQEKPTGTSNSATNDSGANSSSNVSSSDNEPNQSLPPTPEKNQSLPEDAPTQ